MRICVHQFSIANDAYIGASVSLYTVDGSGAKTTTLATLYDGTTDSGTLSNPQTMDSEGKFYQPVYIGEPVIAVINGTGLSDHDTGIINLIVNPRLSWATDTVYAVNDLVSDDEGTGNIYICNLRHLSEMFATDRDTNQYWSKFIDLEAVKTWSDSAGVSALSAAASAANAAAVVVGALQAEDNLSDVGDVPETRANLGLGTAAVEDVATGGTGALLRVDGDGSALTGISGGASEAEKANILLNAFRIAQIGGLSVQNMLDGVVDEFEDETGVDTGAASNAIYDAAGNFYGNGTIGVVDSYSSATNYFNAYTGSDATVGQALTLSAAEKLHSVSFKLAKIGSPTGTCLAKLYATSGTVGSDAIPIGAALASSPTLDISTLAGSATDYEFVFSAPYSASAGDFCVLLEVAGGDASNYVRVFGLTGSGHAGNGIKSNYIGSGWTAASVTDISFILKEITVLNMAVPSNPVTALAQADDVFAVLWTEDIDAVTLNTDLLFYASRDDGATWTQGSLSQEAVLGAGQILTANVDVSGQPAGTDMKWKIVTANGKNLLVHAVALEWS